MTTSTKTAARITIFASNESCSSDSPKVWMCEHAHRMRSGEFDDGCYAILRNSDGWAQSPERPVSDAGLALSAKLALLREHGDKGWFTRAELDQCEIVIDRRIHS